MEGKALIRMWFQVGKIVTGIRKFGRQLIQKFKQFIVI